MLTAAQDFQINGMMMRYSNFVPKLVNFCLSLGFEPGSIMPSRAFCSDENQGFPIILLTQNFGVFPFNHGRVGGIVATDRHGPHAHHGKDIVIIQASHVGYNPETTEFGVYRRMQTTDHTLTSDCGKICGVCDWYSAEYLYAQKNIFLTMENDRKLIILDNQLLSTERDEGLTLSLDQLIASPSNAIHVYSTSKAFLASSSFIKAVPEQIWQAGIKTPIGQHLTSELFSFKREIASETEGQNHLEHNLFPVMPAIVTADYPALEAAKYNTVVEFDRTFRTIVRSSDYRAKNLLFISGLNIDISPKEGQIFPLTKYVPWAAYIQTENGSSYTLEQSELVAKLNEQSSDNPLKINMEAAIEGMMDAEEVKVQL